MKSKRVAAKRFAGFLALSFIMTGFFVMCTTPTEDFIPEPPENGTTTLDSLTLTEADFTHSVSIAHDYLSQILMGSTARLSVEVNKSEFAHSVKEIRVENVRLVRNSVTYCTLSSQSIGGPRFSATLTNTSSTPYIPKGEYTYSADLYYTLDSSSEKTTEHKLGISGTATSVSPDATKFTVDVNLDGYTSYSCYKGSDGQSRNVNTANGKENATIYNVSATYKNGLTPNIYNQCSNLITIKTYIDNVEASGDVGEQPLGPHTISASVSFDGSHPTTCPTTRTVHITGLPFKNNTLSSSYWEDTAYCTFENDYVQLGLASGSQSGIGKMSFKKIYVPSSSISVKVTTDFSLYTSGYTPRLAKKTTFNCNIAGSNVISQVSPDNGPILNDYKRSGEGTITSSNNSIYLESTSTVSGPYVRVKTFALEYK